MDAIGKLQFLRAIVFFFISAVYLWALNTRNAKLSSFLGFASWKLDGPYSPSDDY